MEHKEVMHLYITPCCVCSITLMTESLQYELWCIFTGDIYTVQTPDLGGRHEYNLFWMTPTSELFTFYVKGCMDAHVAIAEVPYRVNVAASFEVVIGGWDNSRSVIRRGKSVSRWTTIDVNRRALLTKN